jgi:hypothetical protein
MILMVLSMLLYVTQTLQLEMKVASFEASETRFEVLDFSHTGTGIPVPVDQ